MQEMLIILLLTAIVTFPLGFLLGILFERTKQKIDIDAFKYKPLPDRRVGTLDGMPVMQNPDVPANTVIVKPVNRDHNQMASSVSGFPKPKVVQKRKDDEQTAAFMESMIGKTRDKGSFVL